MSKDRRELSNFYLDDRLFDAFNLKVSEAVPVRSVFILETDKGVKILKRVKYPIEDLMFIYNSLNKIREGYPYVVNFRLTKDEKPYLIYNDEVYVILDCINAREALFENPLDLKKVSINLARFHKAGENIGNYERKNLKGKMIERLTLRIKNLEKFKDIADMHVNKTKFDEIFLQHVDYYIEKIKEAVDFLEKADYNNLKDCVFCHHDLAHHNIMIDEDNVYFVDFDFCVLDSRIHDLANIINKALKDNNFTVDTANIILDSYSKEYKLSKHEINILYGFLLFPKDFYDISRDYYFKTKLWDEEEYLDKLIRKAGYKEDIEKFLKDFKKIWL